MTQTEIVLKAFTAIFNDFDADMAQKLLAPDYIQHNLAFPTGSAPVIGFIPAMKESGISYTAHRVLTDGNLVVMHNTYDNAQLFGGEKLVAFDILRVEDGKLVEHWDNLQPWADETASGRTMVDGPTKVTDLDKTEANREMFKRFYDDIMYGKAPDKAAEYISSKQYDQHNPAVGDGLEGFGAALQAFAESGQTMAYESTPIMVVEGNFAFAASEGKFGETPTAFYDLLRIEDGLIVEHWDVVAEIPPKSEWKNENGKF
jgi:predicted SnoaL-like aldol condensation-catalyzing enzyme